MNQLCQVGHWYKSMGNKVTKELELAKKLALLGWIHRNGLLTEEEYNKVKSGVMREYNIISFVDT